VIPHLRIARPVGDLALSTAMYCRGLGLQVIDGFADHDGFDGVMLGAEGAGYHFEFTRSRTHRVAPTPTPEDLTVLYLPGAAEWQAACAAMSAAGFRRVESANPYWDARGRTFEDPDGYRVVLHQAAWRNTGSRQPNPDPRRFSATGLALIPLVALCLTAAGCTTTWARGSEVSTGSNPIDVTWTSRDGGITGTLTARTADGRSFSGPFQEPTRLSVAPYWYGGDFYGWNDGFAASNPFRTDSSGDVVADLVDARGMHLNCRLRLLSPARGISGGGGGECRIGDTARWHAQLTPT